MGNQSKQGKQVKKGKGATKRGLESKVAKLDKAIMRMEAKHDALLAKVREDLDTTLDAVLDESEDWMTGVEVDFTAEELRLLADQLDKAVPKLNKLFDQTQDLIAQVDEAEEALAAL